MLSRNIDAQAIIDVFDAMFFARYNTRLVRGEGEPIYLPADEHCEYHRIEFAHGYVASALHEVAHWCIAGAQRRLQEDYGYWYCPDGRDLQQQAQFESVEVKPQALEWAFSVAIGKAFSVSTDNLNGAPVDRRGFTLNVYQQVLEYLERGFPPRAQTFIDGLRNLAQTPPLSVADFTHPFMQRTFDAAI